MGRHFTLQNSSLQSDVGLPSSISPTAAPRHKHTVPNQPIHRCELHQTDLPTGGRRFWSVLGNSELPLIISLIIQWDPYNVDTLWNEKSVLITEVSSFQGRVYIRRVGQLIIGTFDSVHIIEVSTFQGCPQGGVRLF